ncbi:MAG: DUF429 domain-containing protein [Thermoplasmata archaeon]
MGSQRKRPARPLVLGLDLAGSPQRSTGCCLLDKDGTARTSVANSDQEILDLAQNPNLQLVTIDAPLSLPRGRESIDDRSGPHFRECDQELRRLGIRFFPLTLGPMRMLTMRGMRLAGEFRQLGMTTVEGYPGGAQDLLGIRRKGAGIPELQEALVRLGITGDLRRRRLTHDELDAATIAWVGWRFLEGNARVIGDPAEGIMILPSSRKSGRSAARPPGKESALRQK